MPSFKTPIQQQIDIAVQRMRSPEFAAYFLSRLENPKWVAPLNEEGLFASPPPPVTADDGSTSFPHWPASRYLARMAVHVPSEVAAIFASVETDNILVMGNMVEAAQVMPATEAATLVPAICRAVKRGLLSLHFKDASELCVRLEAGDEVSAAMTLADALFTPKFAEGQQRLIPQDEYWYKDGLKKVVPALAEHAPREFLPKLCDWLKASVSAKEHVEAESGLDYSWIWRPAIEEHPENQDFDFAGVMAGFVRGGFEQAIRGGRTSLEEALETVQRYQYLIFKRIRLHLINEFAESNRELARRTMMDHDLFDDYQYKHEYAMLAGRRFQLLTSEERDAWFGWIEAGNEYLKWRLARDATDEDRENTRRYWKFEKLHWVREHLKGERREFYEAMLAKHGEPELADLNSRIRTARSRIESPLSVDDLAKLSFEEAVERVSTWAPDKHGDIWHTREDLAAAFGQYIASKHEAFSAKARALKGMPAIYVRTFIRQMAAAIKCGKEIEVPAVLELCRWVMERPIDERTIPDEGNQGLVDSDWQWTRDDIAEFAQRICEATVEGAPKYAMEGLREPIWNLLGVLCRDRHESYILRDISQEDPRTHDYLELGINSPRGRSVQAALEYARWIANHIKKTEDGQEIVPGGFDAMPEVREMLEWQIAPDNRSVEALSLIGSRVSLLYWIDREWLASHADRLFRLEDIEESSRTAHGWAAWNAFLVWVNPHIEFYRLFKKQFAYAVAQSTQVNLAERTRERPMHHLGEHLMLLYGRGQLGLDDDDGLLRRFLAESNPDIRRHAIGFSGQSLEGDKIIPREVVDRFIALWETYWATKGKRDAEEQPDAWSFGAWFASGKFPEQWALEQLEEFVKIAPTPEPEHVVVQQLAKVSQAGSVRAVRILHRMIRGDREGWRIPGWIDSAKQILGTAMKASGEARAEAESVIDYLARRGYMEFGELLNQ